MIVLFTGTDQLKRTLSLSFNLFFFSDDLKHIRISSCISIIPIWLETIFVFSFHPFFPFFPSFLSSSCPFHVLFLIIRECDPDICGQCGVSVHPTVLGQVEKALLDAQDLKEGKQRSIGFRMCCNSNMRRGIYKKTRVGRSTISGWGLFLLEDANKRDFIMEYKGEI